MVSKQLVKSVIGCALFLMVFGGVVAPYLGVPAYDHTPIPYVAALLGAILGYVAEKIWQKKCERRGV